VSTLGVTVARDELRQDEGQNKRVRENRRFWVACLVVTNLIQNVNVNESNGESSEAEKKYQRKVKRKAKKQRLTLKVKNLVHAQ
jgi:hypothetical protein